MIHLLFLPYCSFFQHIEQNHIQGHKPSSQSDFDLNVLDLRPMHHVWGVVYHSSCHLANIA